VCVCVCVYASSLYICVLFHLFVYQCLLLFLDLYLYVCVRLFLSL